jgi:MFS family permease
LPLIIADIFLFLYQDEPLRQSQGNIDFKSIWSILQVKQFRNYLFFFSLWTILIGTLTPYTSYIMFKVFRLPFVLVSGLTVLATVTSTILYVAWGKVQDRYGVFSVYRYVLPGLAIVYGLWAFVTTQSFCLYLLIFILTGALNAATLVGGFCLLLTVIPVENRPVFLTVNSVSIGLAGFLGPNLGAGMLGLFERWKLNLFALNFSPLQNLFFIGSISSLLLALTFHKFVKPRSDKSFNLTDIVD